MKTTTFLTSCSLALVAAFGVSSTALAQNAGAPASDFGKADAEVTEGTEWKAQAQGGLILTTGNSRSTSLSFGAHASMKSGPNKLSLDGTVAFAESSFRSFNDSNGNGTIDSDAEIQNNTQTITELYAAKARYDRFLTDNDSLYLAGLIQRNEPAGQKLLGSGQAGYSRRIFKDAMHELVGELGYDFSYLEFVTGGDITAHSARAFLGYEGALSEDTGISLWVEYLGNLNSYSTPVEDADFLKDSRVNGNASISTKLSDAISFRFSFTARYDDIPAPAAAIAGADVTAGQVIAAEKLDTLTEATLIVNLL